MDFKRTEDIINNIFKKTTIKRAYLADSLDTAAMRSSYAKYRNSMNDDDLIEYHSLVVSDFANTDLSLNNEAIIACLKDSKAVYNYLDETQCAVVLSNIRTRITSQYVEKNTYYRIICGLPDLQDNLPIYVTEADKDICDITKPIHTMTDTELKALYTRGTLTTLAEKYPNLMYIPYLHRRANLITAREASDFDIIVQGVDENELEITDTFFNHYNKNKNTFLQRHLNTFYQRTTDYYESLMTMILVWSTRIDTIREVHANIDIDYYDDYDLAYIFQDYSLTIDDSISTEIRADIAKNINLLVRNRGTNEVLQNLADIFNIKNIYNYVIQKLYVNGEPTLRCHAVPVKDMGNMSKYLTREYGFITYGKLVENDDSWGDKQISNKTTTQMEQAETDEYRSTYERLLSTDFSYIHSKYISVDNIINMSQMSMDFSLFFNYLLSKTAVHTLTVHHRLSDTHLTLVQVYAYLCSLLSMKYKFKDNMVANSSELSYILGLNDTYTTTSEFMRYDTISYEVTEYEDKEVITYPENPNPTTKTIIVPKTVNTSVDGYVSSEVFGQSKEVPITSTIKVDTPQAVSSSLNGYVSSEVFNQVTTVDASETTSQDTPQTVNSSVDGYVTSEVFNQTVTVGASSTTYAVNTSVDGYVSSEVFTKAPETTTTDPGTTTGDPIITIIKVPVVKTKYETAWHKYIISEVEINDVLRLFEGHFSGTDYMYLLQNWISLNPAGTFEDFIDTFCNDRKIIYILKDILRETHDAGQYHVAQTIIHYMTRMKAKTSVYGNITTYSEYLKDTSPTLYAYYQDMITDLNENKWSQTFSDEIVYVLNLITKLIAELDNDYYTSVFSFIEDVRDTQINELKSVLSYLVSYFTSMSVTVKDPSFKYELGDEEDSLLAKEGMFKTFSDRKLNGFNETTEQLIVKRKKSFGESFMFREYLAIKINKLKEKKIGG